MELEESPLGHPHLQRNVEKILALVFAIHLILETFNAYSSQKLSQFAQLLISLLIFVISCSTNLFGFVEHFLNYCLKKCLDPKDLS